MRFKYLLIAFGFILAASSGTSQPNNQPVFAHESSDLSVDDRVKFGTLPNGLKYAVLANSEPKQRTSLRLLVLGGSLHEGDDQRGLAHFLEHMAFNGSTHYEPGTMVEYFQRLGMNFGGDTNAYTSFDHTVYMLELPDSAKETLAEGFRVFGDYAGGLLLLESEINRERGIILSERRARDSVEFRQTVAEFNFLLGQTKIAHRMPIGTEEVISKANRERFTAYYDHYYRPERMAVIAVGDFDAETVEQQLREAFSGLKGRGEDPPPLQLGKISETHEVVTHHHFDAEAAATTVSIQTVEPYSPEPDNKAKRLRLLPRDLALSMLNRRFAILAKKEDAPFIRGSASASYGLNYFLNASVELVCKPENWAASLAVAENELRRALEFGFDPAELKEATANTLNSLEQAVQTASTRRSDSLTRELIQCLVGAEVFTTPAFDLEMYRPALAAVTPEECRLALQKAFSAPGKHVSVMGNAKIEGAEVQKEIASAFAAATSRPVERSEQQLDSDFKYADFGKAGQVEEQKHVDDLDLDLVRFSNGVRLNVKRTDFEAGRVQLSIRIGGGQLTEPKEKVGLAFFTSSTLTSGGLGKHNIDDLQRILAGKTVGLGFRVASDAFVFSGTTNQADLLLQLQLLAAYVSDPGFRPEALRMARKRFEPMYQQLEHTPSGPLQLQVPRVLAGGDPRFGIPPKDQLLQRDLDDVRSWVEPQFKSGPIEIAVIGDLDRAKVVEAVAQTFGTLAPRAAKPAYEAERRVTIPPPRTEEFSVATEIPKGVVALHWPTTDARDVKIARRLNLLANVFSDRMRLQIREKLGESYSPDAASAPDNTYRNYGFLYTYITVDPAKTTAVIDAVVAIADDLVKNGITDDEFTRAKKPILTALRESARTNSYWLNSVLSSAQENPQHLDWSRSRYSDIESITKTEVEALAKQYLAPDRAFRFVVLPQKK